MRALIGLKPCFYLRIRLWARDFYEVIAVIVYYGHLKIVRTVRLWLSEVLDLNKVLTVWLKLRVKLLFCQLHLIYVKTTGWRKIQLKHCTWTALIVRSIDTDKMAQNVRHVLFLLERCPHVVWLDRLRWFKPSYRFNVSFFHIVVRHNSHSSS